MVLGTVGYGVKLLRQMAAFEMDRRRAEQQLLIRAKAMEAAANAIVITDREGKIIWVNPSFTRLTGYPADEAIGRNPRLLKSGKQNTAFFTNLWETITSDKVWEGELTNRRKDGTFYAQHMTITPIHGLKNTDTCYIAIMEDITVRKQAELKAMLLEASAEAALDGIMAVDNEGHTLLVNRQFGEMWKIPQSLLDAKDDQQLLAYVLTQLKQPEEFIQKVAYLYQHKDEQSRDEIEFLDGQRFDRYSAPLRSADDQIQGRLWYFRNITARRSAGTEKS